MNCYEYQVLRKANLPSIAQLHFVLIVTSMMTNNMCLAMMPQQGSSIEWACNTRKQSFFFTGLNKALVLFSTQPATLPHRRGVTAKKPLG